MKIKILLFFFVFSTYSNVFAAKKEMQNEEEEISQLANLAPFSDIAVIQKKYLPKTKRFEFYPNFGILMNNAFFLNPSLEARLAYSFTEKWAVEAILTYNMEMEQKVTKQLKDRGVQTSTLAQPELYYGVDAKWSPVYGKMGQFSSSVVPFDMYFSGGLGFTSTNQDTSPLTIHIGTGQSFAWSKSMAFRWDVSIYRYSTDIRDPDTNQIASQSFMDFIFSVGVSFFFPEATYR